MVRVATTAKFPTTAVTLADIGLFTNDEDLILTADATSGAASFTVDDPTAFAIGMWIAVRGVNGLEIVQVTAINLLTKVVTITRGNDGTTAIAHSIAERGIATIPAQALNQMRDELIAIETFLGMDGDCIHWDRGLELEPSSDTCAILTLNLQSTRTNKKFISFKVDDVETGGILYDSANDAIEFQNIRVDIGPGSDLLIEDNRLIRFGSSSPATIGYVSANDLVRYTSDKPLQIRTTTGSLTTAYINNADRTLSIRSTSNSYSQSGAGTIKALVTSHIDESPTTLCYVAARHSNTSTTATVMAGIRSRGTEAVPLAVQSGDTAMSQVSLGYDGANYVIMTLLQSQVDGAVAAGIAPGRLVISTMNSAGSITEALRLDSTQTSIFSGTARATSDNTLDLGTSAFRWRGLYLGPSSLHILNAASDANDLVSLGSSGLRMGAGGASALDLTQTRQAASLWETTGNLAGSVRHGMTSAGVPIISGRLIAADANSAWHLGADVGLSFGSGGASARDVHYARQAASIMQLTGSLAGSIRYGMSGAATPLLALHLAAADANPASQILKDRISFGAGGASAVDYELVRTGSNLGTLSGTLTASADNTYDLGAVATRWRNVYAVSITATSISAGSILPAADNTFDLGSASFRWRDVYAAGTSFRVIGTVGDANPTTRLGSALLSFGAGGVSATDWTLSRTGAAAASVSAGTLALAYLSSGNVVFTGASGLLTQDNGNFTYASGALTVKGPGATLITNLALANTTAGGGQFNVQTFAGALGSAAAGDVLITNSIGHMLISPNIAGKSLKLVGGAWTGNIGLTILDGGNVDVSTGSLLIGNIATIDSNRRFVVDWTPGSDNTYSLGTTALRVQHFYGGTDFQLLAAASDANPIWKVSSTGSQYGAGGGTALDTTIARQAASVLQLTGSLAGSVRYGMSGAAVAFISGRLAAADANSVFHLDTTGILSFGAGGATARDIFIERVVPTANKLIHLGAAAGGTTGVWIDTSTPGIILKDAAGSPHYWRITIDTAGALVTTDIGTSLP